MTSSQVLVDIWNMRHKRKGTVPESSDPLPGRLGQRYRNTSLGKHVRAPLTTFLKTAIVQSPKAQGSMLISVFRLVDKPEFDCSTQARHSEPRSTTS